MSNRTVLLGEILKNVSRSFYLTLRVLPDGLREPIGLAYLLARTADTITDTSLISSANRIKLLLLLRDSINHPNRSTDLSELHSELAKQPLSSHELTLLNSVESMLALLAVQHQDDREAIQHVVTTLITGMELDLHTFPDERAGHIIALNTLEELDHYTYLIAGCVGEFWTHLSCLHRPEVRHWNRQIMSVRGIQFGKALQITNIVRDCAQDLRIGRCYVPITLLNKYGLHPNDLLTPQNSLGAKPILIDLIKIALNHFQEATKYLFAIPRRCVRLRLACVWPIVIGLETLLLLVQSNNSWLDPLRTSKVKRNKIYCLVAKSLPIIGSNTLLKFWINHLISAIETEIESASVNSQTYS